MLPLLMLPEDDEAKLRYLDHWLKVMETDVIRIRQRMPQMPDSVGIPASGPYPPVVVVPPYTTTTPAPTTTTTTPVPTTTTTTLPPTTTTTTPVPTTTTTLAPTTTTTTPAPTTTTTLPPTTTTTTLPPTTTTTTTTSTTTTLGAACTTPIVMSGTVSVGNWNDEAGGTTNIHNSIDESFGSPTDSDYIRLGRNRTSDTCKFSRGTSIVSPSVVAITGVTLQVRALDMFSGGSSVTLRVYKTGGATQLASFTALTSVASSYTNYTRTGTLLNTTPNDWTNIEVWLTGTTPNGGKTDQFRVSCLDIDICYTHI